MTAQGHFAANKLELSSKITTFPYLFVQINIRQRLAAINKNSPARVFFLPSLSIQNIVNNTPEKKKKKRKIKFQEHKMNMAVCVLLFPTMGESISHSYYILENSTHKPDFVISSSLLYLHKAEFRHHHFY